MKKIIVSIIVIGLLLATSIASVNAVNCEPKFIIYVDDDNTEGPWDGTLEHPYQYIQDGTSVAVDGDIVYVFSGIYHERVSVYNSVELIGEDRDTTIIDGGEGGYVVAVNGNGQKISGFTIQNSSDSSAGIVIPLHSNNEIVGNNITDSYFGITLWDSSSNNIIKDNNIMNTNYGVSQKYDSDNNTISGNHFTENSCSIFIYDSCDNTSVYENTFVGNSGDCIAAFGSSNISIANNILKDNNGVGILLCHSFDCSITDNIIINSGGSGICTGGDVCERHNISGNTVINSGGRGIELSPGSNSTITNNRIDTTILDGISLLFNSENNIISGNIINNTGGDGIHVSVWNFVEEFLGNEINGNVVTNSSKTGISLDYSTYYYNKSNSNISNNVVKDNNNHGIYLGGDNYTIAGNIINNNSGNGIFLDFSWYNTITENFIEYNDGNGIELKCAGVNEIYGNIIRYSTKGIYMWIDSIENCIHENTIANNNVGIKSADGYLIGNIDNTFYHNNFTDNNLNAYDLYTNAWDDGYPSGGNYWSDYTGNDSDGDGIGDTPYPIPGGDNEDRYPLMEPWGNEPPYAPSIDGPISGKPGTEYSYTFVSTDPNGDDIANYTIDWGDDNVEVVEGPVGSGEIITVSHTWDEQGTYIISAKATDIYGAESEWGILTVTMPKNQAHQQSQQISQQQSQQHLQIVPQQITLLRGFPANN